MLTRARGVYPYYKREISIHMCGDEDTGDDDDIAALPRGRFG